MAKTCNYKSLTMQKEQWYLKKNDELLTKLK